MKAVVYHGPGKKSWEEVPDPVLQDPTDAIVKVETTTICGTDLHILKGDVPAVTEGRILGHEGVGVVTEVGPECTEVKVGDRVIVSCVTTCMDCDYCRGGLTSHCQTVGGIGWIFGQVAEGDTLLVVGAGPVGLSAIMTATTRDAPTAPVRAAGRHPSTGRPVASEPGPARQPPASRSRASGSLSSTRGPSTAITPSSARRRSARLNASGVVPSREATSFFGAVRATAGPASPWTAGSSSRWPASRAGTDSRS